MLSIVIANGVTTITKIYRHSQTSGNKKIVIRPKIVVEIISDNGIQEPLINLNQFIL